MNYYKEVENFYGKHRNSLEKVEIYLSKKLNMPKTIIRDTIKSYLVRINDGCNLEQNIGYSTKQSIKMFFVYYLLLIYIFIKGIFFKDEDKQCEVDVIFDYLEESSNKYYGELLDGKYNKAFINTSTKKNFLNYSDTIPLLKNKNIDEYSYSNKYIFDLYKSILFSFFFFHKVSKEVDINFVFIVLSIYKQILLIQTNLNNVKAKVFISYSDNAFNALRYHFYKKSFNKIMLIQNGARAGFSSCYPGNMYSYCDYYFTFGNKSTDVLKGIVCKNIVAVGSFKLYDNIKKNYDNTIKNDVLFIEQLGPGCGFHKESYLRCIEMICRFAKEYEYKIVYRVAMTREALVKQGKECSLVDERRRTAKIIDKMLLEAGILIDENKSSNSYEAVSNSNVICFYTSTLGFESLGFNKKVLNLNLDSMGQSFSFKDEIGVLLEDNQCLFEKKLLNLIKNSNNDIEEYYKDKRKSYMNLNGDPRKKVASYLNDEIRRNRI